MGACTSTQIGSVQNRRSLEGGFLSDWGRHDFTFRIQNGVEKPGASAQKWPFPFCSGATASGAYGSHAKSLAPDYDFPALAAPLVLASARLHLGGLSPVGADAPGRVQGEYLYDQHAICGGD